MELLPIWQKNISIVFSFYHGFFSEFTFVWNFEKLNIFFFNFLKMFGCLAMVYAIQFVKHFTLCVTAIFWLSNRLENISDSLVLLGGAGLSRPGRC